MEYNCTYKGFTHAGLVRDINEDNYQIIQIFKGDNKGQQVKVTLAVVADGMGGAKAGEVASAKAVQTVMDEFKNLKKIPDPNGIEEFLRSTFIIAHNQIATIAMGDSEKAGLGTTLTVLLIMENIAHVMWIGDSRIYLLRKENKIIDPITKDKEFKLVTSDHSMIWEEIKKGKVGLDDAEQLDNSHIITQSLGSFQHLPDSEYKSIELVDGDLIFMCTDGINRHIRTQDLKVFVLDMTQSDISSVLQRLKDRILESGAEDNFTALAMSYSNSSVQNSGAKKSVWDKLWRSKFELGFGLLLLISLVIFVSNMGSMNNESIPPSKVDNAIPSIEMTEDNFEDIEPQIEESISKTRFDSIEQAHQKALEIWNLVYEDISKLYADVLAEKGEGKDYNVIKFSLQTLIEEKENRLKIINLKNHESIVVFEDTEFLYNSLMEDFINWKKENRKNEK